MKGEKQELPITKISLEDFKKLRLKGYEHRMHFYQKTEEGEKPIKHKDIGEFVTDSRGGQHYVTFDNTYSRAEWDEVDLTKIVEENIEYSKHYGYTNPICVAIHKQGDKKKILFDLPFPEIDNKHIELISGSYLNKYLTPGGAQTYLLRCNVKHLYSKRNYFYTTDDYFEIDKRETKAVYLIIW